MKKSFTLLGLLFFVFTTHTFSQTTGPGSVMNEIFQRTDLIPAASGLDDPWEITYGPDDSLWVTESKGYKVYKVSPVSGAKRTILDLNPGASGYLTAGEHTTFNRKSWGTAYPWPQGGLMGLAIHPDFNNATTPKKYVYLAYVHDSVRIYTNGSGQFYTNWLVRFTYNTTTGHLESPVAICDTIPGSKDHNSGRIIITPNSGVNYLFYAQGDMGAGQFENSTRVEYAQVITKYEGKILRFNLEPDGDAGAYDKWIPSSAGDPNPFNSPKQSAVYCLGIRNNQGFAAAKINGTDFLYGSSHGPFSDDELNIFTKSGNYGHPLVIGSSTDANYDGAGAGVTTTYSGSLPTISSEATAAGAIANYHDPLFTLGRALQGTLPANASAQGTVRRMYWDFNHGAQSNANWPSEAPSGMDIYTNSIIPGWKNSLLVGALKGGKVIRLKLTSTGDGIVTSPVDTISYFRSINRFRDLAISPDGKSIFTVIDKSQTTSGPTTGNPIISACAGCIQKYTFLGYAVSGNTSTIPSTIPIASGIANTCENANTITIDATNNNYWVPVTDTNSNVIAEINANGNNLGNVTTSIYVNTGGVREQPATKALYLDRNITITPQTQPTGPKKVSIRLYLSNTEFTALKSATNSASQPSGVVNPTDLSIYKNSDPCGSSITGAAVRMTTIKQAAFGAGGYALQADSISSFSTFYIANMVALLPVHLLSFNGVVTNNIGQLTWLTEDEKGAKYFAVERSTNGRDFYTAGTVQAENNTGKITYNFPDSAVSSLSSQVVFYRLKIIDADGQFSYSATIKLNLDRYRGSITIRPNPVINDATIEVNAVVGEKANWQLTDITGKTVLRHSVVLVKGDNTITIRLADLPAGIYYLKVSGNNINQAVKLQKL